MSTGKTRIHLTASRVHKWLALVIGMQLLIWFSSGAVMSFLPIEKVHGDHLVDRSRIEKLPAAVDLSRVDFDGANAVRIAMVDGRPVARVERGDMSQLVDLTSGKSRSELSAGEARSIAQAAWRGEAKASTIARITTESTEYRGALPAWRVDFADDDDTHVYVEAGSGRIAAVRTGTWRLYDFFWGLHIMDWQNHENFNSWWLLAFALGGLALGLAGLVLLFMRWPLRRRRPRQSTESRAP